MDLLDEILMCIGSWGIGGAMALRYAHPLVRSFVMQDEVERVGKWAGWIGWPAFVGGVVLAILR